MATHGQPDHDQYDEDDPMELDPLDLPEGEMDEILGEKIFASYDDSSFVPVNTIPNTNPVVNPPITKPNPENFAPLSGSIDSKSFANFALILFK
jgi:hypothetical protein